jgi:hypothetical protein
LKIRALYWLIGRSAANGESTSSTGKSASSGERAMKRTKPTNASQVKDEEAYRIGVEAFVYLYPLISMDVTRRVTTNLPPGRKEGLGPISQFNHFRAYPAADFRETARPNFDTLVSSAWLDLTAEPMIVSTPETGHRYYLLPMMDMWTDVFAAPGTRTSGPRAADFGVVPPDWQGQLPSGVERIQSPTRYVWIVGRTQTNGPGDYDAVHRIQDGYAITPLSQWGKTRIPAVHRADPSIDMRTPPMLQVNTMSASTYFSYGAALMKFHPPHLTDWSTIARLRRIGIEPGLEWNTLDADVQDALTEAAADGLKAMYEKAPTLARVINGWQLNTDTMGVYGNYYLKRAIMAMVGLGVNQPEDAIHTLNLFDADGQQIRGGNRYTLHFEEDELPPVAAFWSLTMYDAAGFQVPNPINRFAIGDRDLLKYNRNGSLDLYIQYENPGPDREANWLPSPPGGLLGLTMRLYAPRLQALDGRWAPPALRRIETFSTMTAEGNR